MAHRVFFLISDDGFSCSIITLHHFRAQLVIFVVVLYICRDGKVPQPHTKSTNMIAFATLTFIPLLSSVFTKLIYYATVTYLRKSVSG